VAADIHAETAVTAEKARLPKETRLFCGHCGLGVNISR
jgi:hypothetical protein